MHLKKVSLFNFRNHSSTELALVDGINCFVGDNGSGKTNILDAIHYLCLTKSSLNSIDAQSIKHSEDLFSIKGSMINQGDEHELLCALQQGQKKVLKVDKKEYEKLSHHIGRFPLVLIAPNDSDIIRLSSEVRRKFFDGILSQIDQKYLQHLIRYNHFLKQRNAVLKKLKIGQPIDKDLLEPYNIELIRLSKAVANKRTLFLQEFVPLFSSHYLNLSEDKEHVTIQYKSKVTNDNFEKIFKDSLSKDIALQRTNVGIHRDDFEFLIDEESLKKFGSQGQQKSFLIALKLGQFDVIKNEKGFKPLLLLDDIFDKLDDHRISKLIEMVASDHFGQLFITDARPERSTQLLANIDKKLSFFTIENGAVV